MKHLLLSLCMVCFGTAYSQLMTWNGYDIYDHLVIANHPEGCVQDFVTGLPDDSTWVNLYDNSVMTGYFGSSWPNQLGDELLLETSYHRDNYSVRMIKTGGIFSNSVSVTEAQWTQIPNIQWQHIFPECIEGQAFSERYIYPMDFSTFGVAIGEEVIGIEITFLPTVGVPDLAGVYIIAPPCAELSLGPDLTICAGETTDIDATTTGATYLWQDGSTNSVYQNAGPGEYWVELTIDDCTVSDTLQIFEATTTLDLGEDEILCEGDVLVLNATTSGATYLWQDNSTQPTFTVTEAGTYSVQITVNDCVFTDEIEIDYYDLPSIDLGNDTSLCDGATLTLNAFVPGAAYEWQDNSTDSEFQVEYPGVYSVTVTLDGCTTTDEIEVDYIYIEPVDLGDDITLCFEETLFLNAATPGATYEWQDNSTSSGYTVTEPGYYWVIVSIDNCYVTDDIEVDYEEEIIVDLGDDVDLCFGQTLLLDATVNGASYEWQDNSTLSTFLVEEPGSYSVVVTLGNCSGSDEIEINFSQDLIDLGPDQVLCQGETLLLDATTTGANYLWQDNSTGATLLVSDPGNYSVIVDVNGCVSLDTVFISFVDAINTFLGNDTTLCQGATLVIDANTPGATYQWHDNSTLSTYTADQPGSYWVNVNLNGCLSADTIVVEYLNLTTSFLGNDTTLCTGEILTLDAQNPGASYLWQDNSTSSTLIADQPGIYWVKVSLNSCNTRDTMLIDYTVISPVALGNDTTLCQGSSLLLNANSPGSIFQWQDNSMGNSLLVSSPGNYWVIASAGNCSDSDSISVSYSSLSAIDLGNDTTLCEGQTIILDANIAGATYTWQDNSGSSTFLVDQPGTYWVNVNDGACDVSDTMVINFIVISPIDLGGDTTLCQHQSLLLDASHPGATYLWQDNSSLPIVNVTRQGSYWVVVSVGNCEARDTINVNYNSLVDIELGNDTTLCAGELLILDGSSPGASYEWQDGSMQPEFQVTEAGTYFVSVHLNHCVVADSITIAYLDLASIMLGNDTTLCWDGDLTLHAGAPGAQYQWSDLSVEEYLHVTQPGVYWVHVNLDDCAASDTISIDFSEPVVVNIGADTILCPEETLVLDAETIDASYLWNDNTILPAYHVTQSGSYWVLVNVNGCIGSDTVEVSYAAIPPFSLGEDTVLCEGETLLLDATQFQATYLWQDQSTDATWLVNSAGEYSVSVKLNECLTRDTIIIDYKSSLKFTLGDDLILCSDDKVILDPQISEENVEYLWQDQTSTETIEVTSGGLYWLQATDDCGTSVDSISILLEDCSCKIYVPNVFSPNGDHINDELIPFSNCDITSYQFLIFDRAGGLLFETAVLGVGWDGNVKGDRAQVGVYAYVLLYTHQDGEPQLIHGDITVIR